MRLPVINQRQILILHEMHTVNTKRTFRNLLLMTKYTNSENVKSVYNVNVFLRGRRGRDRMVVGFTTTCAISTYHH